MAERFGNVGWIKLWRKSMKNDFYQNGKPFDEFHAWIDLLLLADSEGKVEISLNALKIRWSWGSVKKVRTYLGKLMAQDMVTKKGKSKTSRNIYKISNWESLQEQKGQRKGTSLGHKKGQQEEKRSLKEEKNAIGFSQKESHSSSKKSAKDLVAEWSESNE